MDDRTVGTGPEESTIQTLIRRVAKRSGEPSLDLISTKIAVDFQSITLETAEERLKSGLQSLTDTTGADAAFVALLDADGEIVDTVYAARSTFSACNPEVLKSRELSEFPWIRNRLQHLRLLEIADTGNPSLAQQRDAEQLASLNVGAMLVVGFNLQSKLGGFLGIFSANPNPDWSAELHLALKLVGVSCASGLERIRLHEDLMIFQERDRLVTNTANDGIWDYDVRGNTMYFSPRWRAMLGYESDEDIPEWRFLVHPDDMARVQTQIRDHLEGRTELFESVHRMRHASGEWRWIQSRVKGRLDEHDRVKRLVGVENGHHGAKALRRGALPREGERADHAAIDRRRRGHHRCRR
jgi:PAS domain S-box-containing protein